MVHDLRQLRAHLTVYCYDPTLHQPIDFDNPPTSPKFSTTHFESQLRDFLRDHVPKYCQVFTSITCESTMTDYGALKVPDLKKLLTDRKLPTTGNKADLVKRLQDADKEAETSGTAAAPGMSQAILSQTIASSLCLPHSSRRVLTLRRARIETKHAYHRGRDRLRGR
jgi:SAP domain-containing ribonucleoprotein